MDWSGVDYPGWNFCTFIIYYGIFCFACQLINTFYNIRESRKTPSYAYEPRWGVIIDWVRGAIVLAINCYIGIVLPLSLYSILKAVPVNASYELTELTTNQKFSMGICSLGPAYGVILFLFMLMFWLQPYYLYKHLRSRDTVLTES